MWMENKGTGVKRRRTNSYPETQAPKATKQILTQATSAAVTHSTIVEELNFSISVHRIN